MDISGIDLLGVDRVLKRGTGGIAAERGDALLVRDSLSGAYLLACGDPAQGLSFLDRYLDHDCRLLMVPDIELGRAAFEHYGFTDMLECFQAAYYGPPPAADERISVRTAGREDLPFLLKNYDLISPEEMAMVVARGSLFLGYAGDRLVGFAGEHLEGSMGLLYIFPEFRRRGYAAALENICIAATMERGFIPFGQVEKDNLPSLWLQEKLGMTVSRNLICWMWK